MRPTFADVIGKVQMLFIGGASGNTYEYDFASDSKDVELPNASASVKNSVYAHTKLYVNTNVNAMP